MRIRFWGVRGSIAAPGRDTVRYGGNTPCVEARADDGTLLIFDCGTGARKLGIALARGGPVRAHLFVSHTHADHIQGLPFFLPAFLAGSDLTVYGPAGIDRSFPAALGGQPADGGRRFFRQDGECQARLEHQDRRPAHQRHTGRRRQHQSRSSRHHTLLALQNRRPRF